MPVMPADLPTDVGDAGDFARPYPRFLPPLQRLITRHPRLFVDALKDGEVLKLGGLQKKDPWWLGRLSIKHPVGFQYPQPSAIGFLGRLGR